MTLDDAIDYYDGIAKEYRANADIERNDYMDLRDGAFEAEQLASWLNELKLLRERIEKQPEPCEDAVSRAKLYKSVADAEELARQRVLDSPSTLPYLNNLNPSYTRYLAQLDERTRLKHMIADAPSVTPKLSEDDLEAAYAHGYTDAEAEFRAKMRTGKWVHRGGCLFECDQCGELVTVNAYTPEKASDRFKFCPNCGADMVEGAEQE